MTKINIAIINLQSGVATTKSSLQYFSTVWKYWLPHSNWPIFKAGKMLQKENIDLACITEISEKSLRTGFISQIKVLAKSSNMKFAKFFSIQRFGKFLFYEGNALLSKYAILKTLSHPLHIELMCMALEESVLEIETKKITVFIAHFALTRSQREIQIHEVIEIIKKREGPVILAGDFNERNPELLNFILEETQLKNRISINTYPSWNPKYPLDNIFFSEEFKIIEYYIPQSKPFSDHLPLVAKVELM